MSAEKTAPGLVESNLVEFDRTGRKAKDLVGLLMSHGARIRRAARPRCDVRLAVYTPGGEPAVEIYIE
jgi:hypothetical protein